MQIYRPKPCFICQKVFNPKTSRHKTCSPECQVFLNRSIKSRLQREYYRRNKDKPDYRARRFLLRSLRRCLMARNFRSHIAVDYTGDEFKSAIEAKFLPGMTWANYGCWHIDHIRPLHSFNFTGKDGIIDMDLIREANSLNNLQPLWAKDNLSKNRKWGHAVP